MYIAIIIYKNESLGHDLRVVAGPETSGQVVVDVLCQKNMTVKCEFLLLRVAVHK